MRPLILANIILAAFLLALAVQPAMGQGGSEESSCNVARVWHLQQAMKWSERQYQDYHAGAANAARLLASYSDDSCPGWQDDATAPGYNDEGQAQAGYAAMGVQGG